SSRGYISGGRSTLNELYGTWFRDAGASTCGAVDANGTRSPTRQSPATATAPQPPQKGGTPTKTAAPRNLAANGSAAARAEHVRRFCDGMFNSRAIHIAMRHHANRALPRRIRQHSSVAQRTAHFGGRFSAGAYVKNH